MGVTAADAPAADADAADADADDDNNNVINLFTKNTSIRGHSLLSSHSPAKNENTRYIYMQNTMIIYQGYNSFASFFVL